ncbi:MULTISPECIES: hypothetical protein [unclassified Microcoleus]|uniref:hypothetical protein n=1 Tax=unclassified Microcoleus TaxID=2642155 RepID=UPI002FD3E2FD
MLELLLHYSTKRQLWWQRIVSFCDRAAFLGIFWCLGDRQNPKINKRMCDRAIKNLP